MKTPEQPVDESARLEAVRKLGILDTDPEERFDRITRLAQRLFDVPMVAISLVDRDRQWFKSRIGLAVTETERCVSFCGHTIMSDYPMVVPDTHADERFRDNPLVTGEPRIRFYAGHPIHSMDGQRIGSLCIMDDKPRNLANEQVITLAELANIVDYELIKPESDGVHSEPANEAFKRFLNTVGDIVSSRQKAFCVSAMVFLLVCLFGWGWKSATRDSIAAVNEAAVVERLSNLRGRLETELNARLHLTRGLSGFVRADQDNVDPYRFQAFADDLGHEMTAVRSLQLAPGGVVEYVWPLTGNQKAIGHDLLADPNRRVAAESAIASRRMWLSGPINLIQGGTALIAREPIFVPVEGQSEERFWGFATILVDMPELLAAVELDNEEARSRFAIRSVHDSSDQVFYGNPEIFDIADNIASVPLPGGQWEIALTHDPDERALPVILITGLILLAASGAAAFVYVLLRLPNQYQRAVATTRTALEKTNSLFREAIESLPDGFAVFDREDKLLNSNQRFRDFFETPELLTLSGIKFETLLRITVNQGIVELEDDSEEGQAQFIRERLEQHRNSDQGSSEVKLSSGRWIRTVERQIPSGGCVVSYTDITELKAKEQEIQLAREKAEAANTTKSAFLATVSHELRTPMNAILGVMNLVQSSGDLTRENSHLMETAHNSAERLLQLLNELLDISKMEAGKLELEMSRFSLDTVIHRVVTLARAHAEEKHLHLEYQIAKEANLFVEGDPGRIQQILLNLLGNAIKFTEAGQVSLDVALESRKGADANIKFTVTDTGEGFNEDQADRLFKPFSQLDSSASRKHEGTGLGLAICHRLVTLMGGTIHATSEPGKGATFEFVLPMSVKLPDQVQQPQQPARYQLPKDCGLDAIRVLLAEDSPANQVVFKAMLQNTGYQVDIVGNGREAVDATEKFPYDIILMDIFMPELDGLEATRQIRAGGQLEGAPIIALTANAMQGDKERFLAAGMDDYLPKPVNRAELLKKLEHWTLADITGK